MQVHGYNVLKFANYAIILYIDSQAAVSKLMIIMIILALYSSA